MALVNFRRDMFCFSCMHICLSLLNPIKKAVKYNVFIYKNVIYYLFQKKHYSLVNTKPTKP